MPIYVQYYFWLAAVSIFCFILERIKPWRPEQKAFRNGFWQDVFWLTFNGHYVGVIIAIVSGKLIQLFNTSLYNLGLPVPESLALMQGTPLWLQFVVFFVVKDFIEWNVHRLLHLIPWLWEFHKLHHSIEELDWIGNMRFHWMEAVIYKSISYFPLAVIGVDTNVIFIIAIIGTLIGHLNHSNLAISWGAFRYLLNSPKMHIWHHDVVVRGKGGQNFGITLSVWDWLFGTAYMPDEGQPERLGFEGMENFPRHVFARLFHPFYKWIPRLLGTHKSKGLLTMKKSTSFLLLISVSSFALWQDAVSQEKVEIGFWTQLWYQYVENGKSGKALNDFMARRAYFYAKGQPANYLSFFTHIAVDRYGQDGLDNPSLGLGSGLAFRDAWATLHLSGAFKIQVGRMYVPLTRNYGTTSTKTMLTTDLSFFQGGVRGTIFYASKVGRDDGVTFWGNPFDGRIQYRLMISEGMENNSNPEDRLRFVGRMAVNLLEPEKEWFNQGTYLGQKKVLSLGFGLDNQSDLTLNNQAQQDNLIWTADAFFDHPLAAGAVTVESAYIHIRNNTQTHNFSQLAAGDDAEIFYVQAGYYLPTPIGDGRLQPYTRYETAAVDQKSDTRFYSGGFNYYLKGHNGKISLDYTFVDHSNMDDQSIVTVQLAVGL